MRIDLAPLLGHLQRLAAPDAPVSDAELLARFAQRRDETAFACLVARHGPMVWGVCRRVLGDLHAAEDAFQATFVVLARRAGELRRPEALTGWLFGVARRVARKARRAGWRHGSRQPADGPEPPERAADPLAELTARELLDALDEEVERLPEVYRMPVVLCCLEGLSQEDAARRLGWTPGSVRGRLERGRKQLHARLARRGLTLSSASLAAGAARGQAAAPPGLAGATLKAAFTAGQGTAASRASTEALALAAGVATHAAGGRSKVALMLVTAALATAAGVGLLSGPRPDRGVAALKPGAVRAVEAGAPRPGPNTPARLCQPAGPAVTMQGRTTSFWGLAFSPDGKRLAGGAHDGTAWVWETGTGKRLLTLRASSGIVHDVCFSRDGALLATAADTLQLWDARTGKAIRTLEGAITVSVPGRAIAFSPGDKLLAGTASSPDDKRRLLTPTDENRYGVLTLWETSTGKAVRTLEGSRGGPVAFSPNGRRLAGAGRAGEVTVWDASTGKVVLRLRTGSANAVAFSPDGKRLAAGTDEGALCVWDLGTGKEVFATADAHIKRVVRLCFTSDGRHLISGGQRRHRLGLFEPWAPEHDGEVKVWDARTGKERFAFKTHVSGISGMALSPDGTRVAASTLAGRQPVHVWSLAEGDRGGR
jgi:RNA polymerase sigma factor (sigma-70 family)